MEMVYCPLPPVVGPLMVGVRSGTGAVVVVVSGTVIVVVSGTVVADARPAREPHTGRSRLVSPAEEKDLVASGKAILTVVPVAGVGTPVRVSAVHRLATATICLKCSSITDRSR